MRFSVRRCIHILIGSPKRGGRRKTFPERKRTMTTRLTAMFLAFALAACADTPTERDSDPSADSDALVNYLEQNFWEGGGTDLPDGRTYWVKAATGQPADAPDFPDYLDIYKRFSGDMSEYVGPEEAARVIAEWEAKTGVKWGSEMGWLLHESMKTEPTGGELMEGGRRAVVRFPGGVGVENGRTQNSDNRNNLPRSTKR